MSVPLAKEFEDLRTRNALFWLDEDGYRVVQIQNRRNYHNFDGIGDGNSEYMRQVDKSLNWDGGNWLYDYAFDRIVLPKYIEPTRPAEFRIQGQQLTTLLQVDGTNVEGFRIDDGLYGYSHVEYPDALGEGIDLILAPTRRGLAKVARFDASLAPLDIAFPIAGDTDPQLFDQALIWSNEKPWFAQPIEREIISINGQKYLIKHIPELPITGTVYAQDELITDSVDDNADGAWSYRYLNDDVDWTNCVRESTADSVFPATTLTTCIGGHNIDGADIYRIERSFEFFDTRVIPFGADIDRIQYQLRLHSAQDPDASTDANMSIRMLIGRSTGAASSFNHAYIGSYPGAGPDETEVLFDTPISGLANSTHVRQLYINDQVSGIPVINTSDYTQFVYMNGYDLTGTTPPDDTINAGYYYLIWAYDTADASELTVRYWPVSARFASFLSIPFPFKQYFLDAGNDVAAWAANNTEFDSVLSNLPEYQRRLFYTALEYWDEWYNPGSATGSFGNIPTYYQQIFQRLGNAWYV